MATLPVHGQSQSSFFDTVLNLSLVHENGALSHTRAPFHNQTARASESRQFRFFNLPLEIRRMVYIELVVPPGQVALGSLEGCHQVLVCRGCEIHINCPAQCCIECRTKTSWHFQHQYTEYRCLNVSLANKNLHNELDKVFYTQNTFEFHNTADMTRFLSLVTKNHVDDIRNISISLHAQREMSTEVEPAIRAQCSFTKQGFSVPLLVEALDTLAKCSNLQNLQASFEYQIPRRETWKRFGPWLAADDEEEYRDVLEAIRYNSKHADFQSKWHFHTADTAGPIKALRGDSVQALGRLESNHIADLHRRYESEIIAMTYDAEAVFNIEEDIHLCATHVLLLGRCFRMFKKWSRSKHCPWVEWPRSDPPPEEMMDYECKGDCIHQRLCLDPTQIPPPAIPQSLSFVSPMVFHPGWEVENTPGGEALDLAENIRRGSRIILRNFRNGWYESQDEQQARETRGL